MKPNSISYFLGSHTFLALDINNTITSILPLPHTTLSSFSKDKPLKPIFIKYNKSKYVIIPKWLKNRKIKRLKDVSLKQTHRLLGIGGAKKKSQNVYLSHGFPRILEPEREESLKHKNNLDW